MCGVVASNPQLLPNITDYSAERSLRPMGIVVMQNRWAFISSECLREICRRFVFTASSLDDNEPQDKMSASENGQRQEVKEMKPISADGEYVKDLKTV